MSCVVTAPIISLKPTENNHTYVSLYDQLQKHLSASYTMLMKCHVVKTAIQTF